MVLEFWQNFCSAFNDKHVQISYLGYIITTFLLTRCFSNLAYSFSYIHDFIKSFSYILIFNFWKNLENGVCMQNENMIWILDCA